MAEDSSLLEGRNLNFSKGWVIRFKERAGLTRKKLFGEAATITEEQVLQARDLMKEWMAGYRDSEIWNMDETGIFYAMEPDRSIVTLEEN